jgi:hypothetical protein
MLAILGKAVVRSAKLLKMPALGIFLVLGEAVQVLGAAPFLQ